jgi:hypothetical protein
MTIRRITQRDNPATLAKKAARYEALLQEAVSVAQRKATRAKPVVRKILATVQVEGMAKGLNAKAAALSYQVAKDRGSWQTIIPWQALEQTTPAEEAEAILDTIKHNLHLTETDSWPKPPSGSAAPAVGPAKS